MSSELTYSDAQYAMNQVLAKYGAYADKGLQTLSVYTVYQFCDPERYRLLFTQAYNSVFKYANRVLIPVPITHEHCPAFVMPDLGEKVNSRRIIVANRSCKAGAATQKGTLYHEYIHFLSHSSFYPDYYNSGDVMAPFVVEGATEYLTRNVGNADVVNRQSYELNYQKASAWVNAAGGNYIALLKHVFQGVSCGITSITNK